MPGDKIGSIRGKKNGGALQVMVAAKAAKRNFLQKGVPIPFDHHLGHTRGKPPRGDGVHLDVVNAPLTGQILGKGDDTAFTKDLACKWGIHNIQVNAIAPGWFPTRMSEVMIERNRDAFLKKIPLGRFGSDHDLKGAAAFLASDASDFVTGHVLVVDGGQTA